MKETVEKIKYLNSRLGKVNQSKKEIVNHKIDLWIEITSNYNDLAFEIDEMFFCFHNLKDYRINKDNYLAYDNGIGEIIRNLDEEKIEDPNEVDKIYYNINKIEEKIKNKFENKLDGVDINE